MLNSQFHCFCMFIFHQTDQMFLMLYKYSPPKWESKHSILLEQYSLNFNSTSEFPGDLIKMAILIQ